MHQLRSMLSLIIRSLLVSIQVARLIGLMSSAGLERASEQQLISRMFSVLLKPVPENAIAAFFNSLKLFGMGASWGGFESLAIPFDPTSYRTATKWAHEGQAVRFHIGLENTADLKTDLADAFSAMDQAS